MAVPAAQAQTPDPMDRGPYTPVTMDPFKAGTFSIQEPNSDGGPPTGSATAETFELRGSLYYPADRPTRAPVIVLVHGNHAQCDQGTSPNCVAFKRNDRGYAYLAENLATHGYVVASLDQDQLMARQDGLARGMHQRRTLIAAALDMLHAADEAPLTAEPDTIDGALVGRLDMQRIGLMGHSRGGDAVTSFIDYNRTRPEPGRRYDLRGVISLAPTDYERRAPYGVPYMTLLPHCDGDVSNLQGARFFERGQYRPGDPFPRIQFSVHGTNHNWFNTVWAADGEDTNATDAACATRMPANLRLSGGVSVPDPVTGSTTETGNPAAPSGDLGWNGGGTYTRDNRGSGDPALMGDQEKVGLALMNAFFRRYVGGEVGFESYMTGERTAAGLPLLPQSACPSQEISGVRFTGGTLVAEHTDGDRVSCAERMMTTYFPGAGERLDVLRPEAEGPLTTSALGTSLRSSGFSNPYLADGGISPIPPTTGSGLDWCNPDPEHFTSTVLGYAGLPTAEKGCPLPGAGALGGQSATRENAPINHSYGLQLSAAWDDPVGATGAPALVATRIPAAHRDVSGFKALAFDAAVNFFDARNPERTPAAIVDPSVTTQDFAITLVDGQGHAGTVRAADQRYGNALHPTPGDTTAKVHVVLNQVRVPLADFQALGVDLTDVADVQLTFGAAGYPPSGSIQLADMRFQERVDGPTVLAGDRDGVTPGDLIAATPRAPASPALPAPVGLGGITAAAGCEDAAAPLLGRLVHRVRGGRLVLSGSARDRGCAGIASVQVTVAQAAGKGRCRFVTGSGRLSRPLPCSKRYALVARGTGRWRLAVPGRLRGTYRVVVRVLDENGTFSRATRLTIRA